MLQRLGLLVLAGQQLARAGLERLAELLTAIRETKDLSEDTVTALKDAIEEFRKSFETSSGELLSGEDEQAEPLEHEGQETIARRRPPEPDEKQPEPAEKQ